MKHRSIVSNSWDQFVAQLAQAEGDGWHLVCFQVVPKDSRAVTDKTETIYAIIAKGRAE